jgi:hypothetical protein
MNKKSFAGVVLALSLAASSAFAEGEFSLSLEFNASVLSAEMSPDSDVVVDSMTDSGFNEDETKIGVSYEDELWGASAALAFGNENLRFLSGEIGDMFGDFPLALDELYAWVQPFGGMFKFTGGIFENTDGVADYTDDIDNFGMGVFFPGEDGEPFSEPTEMTDAALVNGFLSEAAVGPVTLQFLLAPNYSKESASVLASEVLFGSAVPVAADARFFRLGGRAIVDLGIGTFAALFKTFQWPAAIENAVWQAAGNPGNIYNGTKQNYTTFGAYFDFTAIENLGVSLGYTGFLPTTDADDVENVFWSGIDLRASWTGIEGLSISTHNNISFASGKEKDWMGLLGKDSSFFTLYNAVGVTKELTEKFSINAEVSNILSTLDYSAAGKFEYDNLGVGAKFIAKVTDNAEFNVGARVDIAKTALSGGLGESDDTVTTFSIPVGIVISF